MSTTLAAMTLPELKEREVSVVSKGVRRSLVLGLVAVLLAAIAVVRIVSTYNVFSQTSDEPAHIATGMEWLQWGTYNFEPLHPPLARIAVAAGPYLSGLRLLDHRNLWIEGMNSCSPGAIIFATYPLRVPACFPSFSSPLFWFGIGHVHATAFVQP